MKKPFVSVIIPFCNEEARIKDCLNTVTKLSYPNYELIFVDDGSTDNGPKIVGEYATDKKLIVAKGPHQGVASARNIGIKHANGEILVFTDADCIFDEGWLNSLVEPLLKDPKVGVSGGPDKTPPTSSLIEKCMDFIMTSLITTGGLRGGKIRLGNYFPRGCNMAVRREILDKVGVFDPRFRRNRGEEAELEERIKKEGYKLIYTAEALVWHRRRPSIKKFWKQSFASGYAYIIRILYTKRFSLIHFLPSLLILSLFFSLVASFFYESALKIFLVIGGGYTLFFLLQAFIATIKLRKVFAFPIVIFLVNLTYLGYGLGLLYKVLLLVKKKEREVSG
ncbi:MAG: glycosyltransferase [Candidatus Woesearchaeota archaeon]